MLPKVQTHCMRSSLTIRSCGSYCWHETSAPELFDAAERLDLHVITSWQLLRHAWQACGQLAHPVVVQVEQRTITSGHLGRHALGFADKERKARILRLYGCI